MHILIRTADILRDRVMEWGLEKGEDLRETAYSLDCSDAGSERK